MNNDSARPLTTGGTRARSAAQVARAATDRIDSQQRAAGATERVKVVATKRGYDNRKVREEGEEFFVLLKPGQKLPSWQQRKEEFDAETVRRDAEIEADGEIEE